MLMVCDRYGHTSAKLRISRSASVTVSIHRIWLPNRTTEYRICTANRCSRTSTNHL